MSLEYEFKATMLDEEFKAIMLDYDLWLVPLG